MWRMADYSAALARRRVVKNHKLKTVKASGTNHDTGKVAIPHSILKSPNKLTKRNGLVNAQHTVLGIKFLEKGEASACLS